MTNFWDFTLENYKRKNIKKESNQISKLMNKRTKNKELFMGKIMIIIITNVLSNAKR